MKITKSNLLAEVTIGYKSKIAKEDRVKINDSMKTSQYLKTIWNEDKLDHVEESVVLLLNRANEVLGWAKISIGGISGTMIDPKVIFQLALKANASSIILSHNHPSGNLKASGQDIALTKKVKEAGKLLDIDMLDHVILTTEGYLSMADEGLM